MSCTSFRRVDLLELGAHDIDAPVGGLLDEDRVQLVIDPAPLAVGGLERQGPDNVSQRAPRKVDYLEVDVIHIVLRVLDALLVGLHFIVNLRVNHRVQVVVGDDLLRIGVHQLLRDVHLIHFVDERNEPVEPGAGEMAVFAQTLDKAPARGPDDPDSHQEKKYDDAAQCPEPHE